jgi:crossover junction endodeoxyribonuclease RusA
MIQICLKGNPISTNSLYKRHGNFIYMTTEGKKLKEYYQLESQRQYKGKLLTEKLEVKIKLYFKDNRRRDWDNWHKLTMDSMTEIIFKDDSQIRKGSVEMFIDKSNPRVEIEINSL